MDLRGAGSHFCSLPLPGSGWCVIPKSGCLYQPVTLLFPLKPSPKPRAAVPEPAESSFKLPCPACSREVTHPRESLAAAGPAAGCRGGRAPRWPPSGAMAHTTLILLTARLGAGRA